MHEAWLQVTRGLSQRKNVPTVEQIQRSMTQFLKVNSEEKVLRCFQQEWHCWDISIWNSHSNTCGSRRIQGGTLYAPRALRTNALPGTSCHTERRWKTFVPPITHDFRQREGLVPFPGKGVSRKFRLSWWCRRIPVSVQEPEMLQAS